MGQTDDGKRDNKNYTIKDGLAFTEDMLLVCNIFAYNLCRKVTEKAALEYFSTFGTVLKLRLAADKKRSRRTAPKVGYINYADAASATKVLLQAQHILQHKKFAVNACDSWHQPQAQIRYDIADALDDEQEQHIGDLSDISTTQPIDTLLQLNDDCLEQICKRLELHDQVRFARVCQRMRSVFEMCCKLEYKVVEMDKLEGMTLWEIRDFFKLAGPCINKLVGTSPCKDRERIVEYIGKCCSNVKSINFDSSKINTNCLRKLLTKMDNVTELHLRDCSLNDSAVMAIKKLPKLEVLSLAENYELTGKYLHEIKSLKSLSLASCGNIQPSYFIEYCKSSIKNLQSLDIRRCERFNATSFSELTTYGEKLEVLKMSCADVNYSGIAQLPRLKHLELYLINFRHQILINLVAHKSNQLEFLKIVGINWMTLEYAQMISEITQLKQLICANNARLDDNCLRNFENLENLEELIMPNCSTITNAGLLSLMRKCRKLRRINVQRCTNITEVFVYDAIKLLQKRSETPKEPVVLQVFKSGINEFTANTPEYLAATSLLKLSFHVPIKLWLEMDNDETPDYDNFIDEDDDDSDEFDDDDLEDDFMIEFDNDAFFVYAEDDDNEDDDDDMHDAYNYFGRVAPYGDDINDII